MIELFTMITLTTYFLANFYSPTGICLHLRLLLIRNFVTTSQKVKVKEGRESWFYFYPELDFKYAHPNYVILYTRISLFIFIVAALFKILSLKFIFGKTNNENKLVYIFLISRCVRVGVSVHVFISCGLSRWRYWS